MNILYNSCHSILEYDEVKLLTELGHTVFSLGAYSNGGKGHYQLPRPAIEGMIEIPELLKISTENPRTNLPQEIFDWADIIISMHMPQFLTENWNKMKNKKVVFRSIGQNTPSIENAIRPLRYEGLKIVRMSPKEDEITGFVGSDALIRFYKDPEEWNNWTGHNKHLINFTQSLLARRQFCHYDSGISIMTGFPTAIYGTGNEDLGTLNGGYLPYELQKGALRDNRAYLYLNTWPSPYTLSFIEAFLTGIPIVALGKKLAEEVVPQPDRISYYEISDIIKNGENGFISDNINELRGYVDQLLQDEQLAKRISQEGRKTAIRLFNKQKAKDEWENFLKTV